MTDPLKKLEGELAGMRPRAASAELVNRIGAELVDRAPSRWADRLLLSAMTAGALAACVIAGVLAMQFQMPAVRPPAPMDVAAATTPRFGDDMQMIARADADELSSMR